MRKNGILFLAGFLELWDNLQFWASIADQEWNDGKEKRKIEHTDVKPGTQKMEEICDLWCLSDAADNTYGRTVHHSSFL